MPTDVGVALNAGGWSCLASMTMLVSSNREVTLQASCLVDLRAARGPGASPLRADWTMVKVGSGIGADCAPGVRPGLHAPNLSATTTAT